MGDGGGAQGSLSTAFAALLWLIPHLSPEEHARIARFFGGGKTQRDGGEVLAARARGGQTVRYQADARSRPHSSAAEVCAASFASVGLAGWCILLDEVELIGRYSPLQRGRSYAELARWLGWDDLDALPGITTVAAFTDDYVAEMFDHRRDEELIPQALEQKGLARQAIPARSVHGGTAAHARRSLGRPDEPALIAPPRAVSPISIMTPTSGVLQTSRSASAWRQSRCANTLSLGSPSGISSASTANERRSRPIRFRPTTPRAPNCNRLPWARTWTRSSLGWRRGTKPSNEAFGLDWPYPLFGFQKRGIDRLLSNQPKNGSWLI